MTANLDTFDEIKRAFHRIHQLSVKTRLEQKSLPNPKIRANMKGAIAGDTVRLHYLSSSPIAF